MEPRPRPFLGAALGALLGLVLLALVWQLGWIEPSRLAVFLIVAGTTLAVAGLLTRSIAAARGGFVTVAVLAGILAGVALTGIPDQFRAGNATDGCTLQARVGDAVVTPGDTTAFDPLVVTADDVIPWTARADAPIVVTERVAGLRVAGFDVPLNTVTVVDGPEAQELAGEVDIAQALAWVRDQSGLGVSGVYHAYGSISGDGGECVVDGYVRLAPATVYATNLLKGLWVTLGVVLILIAWAALSVRGSFTRAERARRDSERVYSDTVTAGASSAGAGSGYAAADSDPSGVTSPEAAGRRDDAREAPREAPAREREETTRTSTRRTSSRASAPDRDTAGGAAESADAVDGEPNDDETRVGEPAPVEEPVDWDGDQAAPADDAPVHPDGESAAAEGDDRIVPAHDEGPEPPSEDEDSGPK